MTRRRCIDRLAWAALAAILGSALWASASMGADLLLVSLPLCG